MKKLSYILLGAIIMLTSTVYAVQISVPSATGSGRLLQSLVNGTYAPASLIAGSNVTISTTTSTITISATPAGSSGNVQFNNSGSFGGSNNLFWDITNNRLGIGTTSPSTTLSVQSTTAGNMSFFGNVQSGTVGGSVSTNVDTSGRTQIIAYGGQGASSHGGAYFTANGFEESWFNLITRSNTVGRRYMRFGNKTDAFAIQLLSDDGNSIASTPFTVQNAAPTNSLFVTNAGNVGIGTSTPAAMLNLGTASSNPGSLRIESSVAGRYTSITSGANTVIQQSSGGVDLTTAQQSLHIGGNENSTLTTGNNNFTITGNAGFGNLGVGTNSPAYKLDVVGGLRAGGFIFDNGAAFGSTDPIFYNQSIASPSTNYAFSQNNTGQSVFNGADVSFRIGNITKMFISSAGNVGVGSTTPAWKFQVAGTRPDFALSDSAGGTNAKHMVFSNRSGNLYIGTSTDVYATSTTPTLTLLANGNVGVGTTTPAAPLNVAGAIVSDEVPVTFSATPTFDWSTSNQLQMTLTSNVTSMTFSNGIRGGGYRLVLCQDGTGSRTVAWATNILWAGGTAPTMTATANKCDIFTFTASFATTSAIKYLGGYVQNF